MILRHRIKGAGVLATTERQIRAQAEKEIPPKIQVSRDFRSRRGDVIVSPERIEIRTVIKKLLESVRVW